MSPSSPNPDIPEKTSVSPPAWQENENDEDLVQDPFWLTLRRRCELCKQRKVREWPIDLRGYRGFFSYQLDMFHAHRDQAGPSGYLAVPSINQSRIGRLRDS